MDDRELGRIGDLGIVLMIGAVLLLFIMAGCATPPQPKPYSEDTPQFMACLVHCRLLMFPIASVLERADSIDCECRKKAEDAPEGT